jgi:hypothetical protein
MGRSYWFECAKCGYRARISGRADRGLNFFVQTIVCRDCKELYDAVTRIRIPDSKPAKLTGLWGKWQHSGFLDRQSIPEKPPSFNSALNRLQYIGVQCFKWVHFKAQCPVASHHRVQNWNEPNKCPRCGSYLEKAAVPYRLWD